jgi:phage replication-related protein YjqB (UPF0714/DUF867 family)
MGATRHLVQHAARIVKVFRFAKNFALHVHRGVGCNDHNIMNRKSLGNDVGFTLRKSLHVRERSLEFERSLIDVSRLDVKRHYTFTKYFVQQLR